MEKEQFLAMRISMENFIGEFGYSERLRNAPKISQVYLALVFCHCLSLLALAAYALCRSSGIGTSYAFMCLWLSLCFMLFSVEGVLKENPTQVRLSIFTGALFSALFVSYSVRFKSSDAVILTIGIFGAVLTAVYVALYYFLVKRFGWYRFDRLERADAKELDMYYSYQTWKSAVWLVLETVVLFGILVVGRLDHSLLTVVSSASLLLFLPIWALAGVYAAQNESHKGFFGFGLCTLWPLTYTLYFAYERMFVNGEKDDRRIHVSKAQIMGCAVCVVLAHAFLYNRIFVVVSNFGKGLKYAAFHLGEPMGSLSLQKEKPKATKHKYVGSVDSSVPTTISTILRPEDFD